MLMTSGLSMAAEGDIDTTKALAYIAGGLTAAAAVTGAMFGLVALIGAAKKAQRAGTESTLRSSRWRSLPPRLFYCPEKG
ncbi:hypothetical protein ACNUI5_33830 [Pseudomonas aeruginosa]